MKTCPQCSTIYEDDYLFCLADGNTLINESGEQETRIVNRVVFSEITAGRQTGEAKTNCPSCGLSNRLNSKFCKKCGTGLSAAFSSGEAYQPLGSRSPLFQQVQNKYDETRAFRSPVFTPPAASGQQHAAASGRKGQTNLLVAVVVIAAAIIGGAVIYSSQTGSGGTASKSQYVNKANSPANSASNSRNASAQNTMRSSAAIGRTGRLTTNVRIRSDSHKDSASLGVHYHNARIEVLDEKSFTTSDGDYATWYRVRVLENGCDIEGRMGCGNDLNEIPGQAATEGWMNAKNISLD